MHVCQRPFLSFTSRGSAMFQSPLLEESYQISEFIADSKQANTRNFLNESDNKIGNRLLSHFSKQNL
jgi:hypothetical protein